MTGQRVWAYHAPASGLEPDTPYASEIPGPRHAAGGTFRTAPSGRSRSFRFTSFGDLAVPGPVGAGFGPTRRTPVTRSTPSRPPTRCSTSSTATSRTPAVVGQAASGITGTTTGTVHLTIGVGGNPTYLASSFFTEPAVGTVIAEVGPPAPGRARRPRKVQ